MQIEVVGRTEFSELVKKLRQVPLKTTREDGSQIFVYENAQISVKEFHPSEVNPTTFYLLRKGLQFQRDLRKLLLSNYGIDTLHLDAAYEIKNEAGEIWGLIPPIVEMTPRNVRYIPGESEINYEDEVTVQIPIINDGVHRAWLAREAGETFTGISIAGADPEFPFYAHPNEWHRLQVFEQVPGDKRDMKRYLRQDNYALYRDFGVLGCGAPRNAQNKGV